jgi:hypothetical protein
MILQYPAVHSTPSRSRTEQSKNSVFRPERGGKKERK